jgi:hypothetical protein
LNTAEVAVARLREIASSFNESPSSTSPSIWASVAPATSAVGIVIPTDATSAPPAESDVAVAVLVESAVTSTAPPLVTSPAAVTTASTSAPEVTRASVTEAEKSTAPLRPNAVVVASARWSPFARTVSCEELPTGAWRPACTRPPETAREPKIVPDRSAPPEAP